MLFSPGLSAVVVTLPIVSHSPTRPIRLALSTPTRRAILIESQTRRALRPTRTPTQRISIPVPTLEDGATSRNEAGCGLQVINVRTVSISPTVTHPRLSVCRMTRSTISRERSKNSSGFYRTMNNTVRCEITGLGLKPSPIRQATTDTLGKMTMFICTSIVLPAVPLRTMLFFILLFWSTTRRSNSATFGGQGDVVEKEKPERQPISAFRWRTGSNRWIL